MKILTRYLLRSLAGPFMFAFVLLTGLLFVNSVAQELDRLAGKGLPTEVIVEALFLVFPHTIALTLPMAVLVAVLYAFGELAAASEIVAMSASGVRPRSLLVPTLAMGIFVGGVTFVFNDRILPEANHRLKNLRTSIREKSPTFQLRERAVNRIDAQDGKGPFFLKANSIDPVSSELTDVVIYDMSRQNAGRRTTYAARGTVAMNRLSTDLQLRLHDGSVYEVGVREPGTFEQTGFSEQLHVIRGVGDLFEDSESDFRGDREMSVSQLRAAARAARAEIDSLRQESQKRTIEAVQRTLGRGSAADSLRAAPDSERYRASSVFDQHTPTLRHTAAAAAGRIGHLDGNAKQYAVEMHKKYVIASACIAFVLLGLPVAIRFPRGGVSLVIVVSTMVLALYQTGLNNGEDLADRGAVDPFWAMWFSNLICLALGLFMVMRMGRWVGSVRGGGWQEMMSRVSSLLTRPFRRRGTSV